MTSVISIMVGHFDSKYSCLVEKNVPIAFILSSRWQDDAESLWCKCVILSYYLQKLQEVGQEKQVGSLNHNSIRLKH